MSAHPTSDTKRAKAREYARNDRILRAKLNMCAVTGCSNELSGNRLCKYHQGKQNERVKRYRTKLKTTIDEMAKEIIRLTALVNTKDAEINSLLTQLEEVIATKKTRFPFRITKADLT